MVAFVELDAARAAPRRVVAFERAGRLRPVSAPDRDSHSPRFAHLSRAVVFLAAVAPGSPDQRSEERRRSSPTPPTASVTGVGASPLAQNGSRPARYAIEIADLDTGLRRRLTLPGPAESDDSPRWSPDDAWISFRRAPVDSPERASVWLVPATGGEARRLPVAGVDARWSP